MQWALSEVSCELAAGQVIGLLGANGAGKSTLIKLLTGLIEPSTGDIEVLGIQVSHGGNLTALHRQLGCLPEASPIYPDMTVADYLHFVAQGRGLTTSACHRAMAQTRVDLSLEEVWTTPIGELSRGFRQRVGVAQAVIHRPALLILDEPTNGLDPTQTHWMRRFIRHLVDSSKTHSGMPTTVLVSTHLLPDVSALCDRALMLQNGRLIHDENLAESATPTLAITLRATQTAAEALSTVIAVCRDKGLMSPLPSVTDSSIYPVRALALLDDVSLRVEPYSIHRFLLTVSPEAITSSGSIAPQLWLGLHQAQFEVLELTVIHQHQERLQAFFAGATKTALSQSHQQTHSPQED
jgi:ABC-2 type transport system ATP-binding protein